MQNETKQIGYLYHAHRIPVRQYVGRSEFENMTLLLSHVYPQLNMAVHCEETGKTFEIDWVEVINLAIDAGIGEKDE